MKPPVIDDNRRRAVRTDSLRTLASRTRPPTSAVTATTLRALHRHHPHVALEDALELRVVLDLDEIDRDTPLGERVDTVLEAALAELTSWRAVPAVSI